MAKVIPPALPLRVTQTPNELRVDLPPWRVPPLKAGLLCAMMTLIGSDVSRWIACRMAPCADFAISVLMLAGILAVFVNASWMGLAIYGLNRLSREEVIVSGTSLSLRQRLLGINQTRTFDREGVRNLRLVRPLFGESVRQALREKRRIKLAEINGGGPGSRALCFDYRGKIIQLGAGLSETQARELLPLLLERLPASAAPPASEIPGPASPQSFAA